MWWIVDLPDPRHQLAARALHGIFAPNDSDTS